MKIPIVVFLNRSQTDSLIPVRNTALILVENSPVSRSMSDNWAYAFRHHIRDGYYDPELQRKVSAEIGAYLVDSFSRDKAIEIRNQIDLLIQNNIKTVVVSCPDGKEISGAIASYMHTKHGYQPFNVPSAYYWSARDLNLCDIPKKVTDFPGVNPLLLKILLDPDHAQKLDQRDTDVNNSLLRSITNRLTSGKANG